MLGFQFAPRIPDLKHRRLYSFAKPSSYPALEPMIAGRINVALIRAQWQDILRVAASTRNRRPLDSASDTKSKDQRWFAASGSVIGERVPRARFRPPQPQTLRVSASLRTPSRSSQ